MKLVACALLACLTGCAAIPSLTSVVLFKSEKTYGPKAEFVLVKVEINNCKTK